MGRTYTLVGRDGKARHGHDFATNPGKLQYHAADTYHAGDPDAHERNSSWEVYTWTQAARNEYDLETRVTLLREARERYEANAASGRQRRPYHRNSPRPAPARGTGKWYPAPRDTDTAEERAEKEAAIINIPDLGSPVIRTSTPTPSLNTETGEHTHPELEERLDTVEGLTIAVTQAADNASRVYAQRYQQLDDVDTRVGDLSDRVGGIELLNTDLDNRMKAIEASKPVIIQIVDSEARIKRELPAGLYHEKFDELLELTRALDPRDRNIWITGPAGGGKTTAVEQVAEVLGLTYGAQGAVSTPFELMGYMNAAGLYVPTEFRRRYEHGGVLLLDEIDGSSANALLAANTATANTVCGFPDGMVHRHGDNYIFANANTWGFGGDANYVGRAKMDYAFLDRFVVIDWPYDERLERAVTGCDEWVDCVQSVRHAAMQAKAQVVISPRASIKGAQLLRAGMKNSRVVSAIFGRYVNIPTWPTWGCEAVNFAARTTAPVMRDTLAREPIPQVPNIAPPVPMHVAA